MFLMSAHFITPKKFDSLNIIRSHLMLNLSIFIVFHRYTVYTYKYMFYLLAKECNLHGTSTKPRSCLPFGSNYLF